MSGNTFGRLFTVTTFGESHGPALGCIVDGCPPGLELSEQDIQPDLERRRTGTSRHTSQRKEPDQVRILSGVFEGRTTGTPIGLLIDNEDQRSRDYEKIKDRFRPGHADYTYQQKYGFRDYRGGGRSSARETVMRVAAGAIARKYLARAARCRHPGLSRAARSAAPGGQVARGRLRQSILLPRSVAARRARRIHDRAASLRRLGRRARERHRDRRAARTRRAGVRQAGCGHRARHDGHQRRQGRGDRRGLRGHRAEGQSASRRDVARRASFRTTRAACSAAFLPARTSW